MDKASGPHSWRFYLTSQAAWKAMYRDCARAVSSIHLEQYIFENDRIGRRFMQLLTAQAAKGIKVHIICDKFGSLRLSGSSLVRKFCESGGRLHCYNSISRWNIFTPWRWFPRDHIKALLIDSSIAYVGGIGIADRMRHWRDTQIRIAGPVVEHIRQAFDNIEQAVRSRVPIHPEGTVHQGSFRYLLNHPKYKSGIYQELAESIENARRYVYITTPYFVPHRQFFQLLERVCQRGVEVILLVPERSDVPLADWVLMSYGDKLLKSGVRIRRYRQQLLHCKSTVIDDRWATIGSMNFDMISFFHNREANLVITDPEAVNELKQHFLIDMGHSSELTLDEWEKLPKWKKALGYAARGLKIFF